jgi:hypothetical protein
MGWNPELIHVVATPTATNTMMVNATARANTKAIQRIGPTGGRSLHKALAPDGDPQSTQATASSLISRLHHPHW